MILTGPNMSGKSVFMRQAALLVILAQMGAFVPARAAPHRAGRPHPHARRARRTTSRAARARSWSRWSRRRASCTTRRRAASSSSTRSGRGTSTFDGLAIAWAVTEELHERGPRGQGAVRHPLPRADRARRAAAARARTSTWRSRSGTTRSSSSTRCGRAAPTAPTASRSRGSPGCPPPVIARAQAHPRRARERADRARRRRSPRPAPRRSPPSSACSRRRSIPSLQGAGRARRGRLTPLQALNLLAEWQQRLRERP